jgi:hypothetical protein
MNQTTSLSLPTQICADPNAEEGPRTDVFTLGLSANSNSDIAKKRLRETAGKTAMPMPQELQ